ncbi:hypothetical protein [Salarchaeum japonicum]|uniref:hypothetical protein n=1 Tax=Salarchaeum japonicum TaxID=555573 RepID=UPI001D0B7BFC|nr:hypothetical protein [Salarchaeum japonicum]
MVDWVAVVFGFALAMVGALSAINHPSIDLLNRWLKSMGTTQRPSQIEMSETSVAIGRIIGPLLVVFGIAIIGTGI